jgi:hypothetical protein
MVDKSSILNFVGLGSLSTVNETLPPLIDISLPSKRICGPGPADLLRDHRRSFPDCCYGFMAACAPRSVYQPNICWLSSEENLLTRSGVPPPDQP